MHQWIECRVDEPAAVLDRSSPDLTPLTDRPQWDIVLAPVDVRQAGSWLLQAPSLAVRQGGMVRQRAVE